MKTRNETKSNVKLCQFTQELHVRWIKRLRCFSVDAFCTCMYTFLFTSFCGSKRSKDTTLKTHKSLSWKREKNKEMYKNVYKGKMFSTVAVGLFQRQNYNRKVWKCFLILNEKPNGISTIDTYEHFSLWSSQRITQEADMECSKIWFNHIKREYKCKNSKKGREVSINLTHSLAM